MSLLSWFLSVRNYHRARPARARRPERSLRLEALEDRCLLNAGGLDPTFGSGGIVNTPVTASAVLIQPNNDIILVGSTTKGSSSVVALARYNQNGTLDTTFGSGGTVVTAISVPVNAAALYPTAGTANDGKIVIIYGDSVERFNANGSVDTSFGSKGVATVTMPLGLPLEGLVIQANGQIVVSGEADNSASKPSFLLTRLNTNGAVDTNFGTKGTATLAVLANSPSTLNTLAIQANGELVVAGCTGVLGSGLYWATARVNTNGTLDTTFDSAGPVPGVVTTHMPNAGIGAFGADLAIYSSTGTDTADAGKIVLVGWDSVTSPAAHYLAMARYNANGTPDTAFGQSGLVLTPVSSMSGRAEAAIQSNGQIVVATGLSLQRYNANGSLDTTFGSGGIVATTAINCVAIQADGRIVTGNLFARDPASEPEIGSFTASPNPVTAGSSTTLTVSNIIDGNPNSTITQVAFYLGSTFLGDGSQSNGVWTFNFSTAGLSTGSYTLSAQAEDSYGVFGDPFALTLEVQ